MSETKKMTNERPVYAFNRKIFCEGMRDGIPIALGYLAVSFSLGIAARNAGLTAFQGFLASLLNNASAGEYAAFTLIAANATYLEVAIITLISNARYLLMSCALTQRFAPGTPFVWNHHCTVRLSESFLYVWSDRAGCARLVSWYRTRNYGWQCIAASGGERPECRTLRNVPCDHYTACKKR